MKDRLKDIAKSESPPRMEGRFLSMILVPDREALDLGRQSRQERPHRLGPLDFLHRTPEPDARRERHLAEVASRFEGAVVDPGGLELLRFVHPLVLSFSWRPWRLVARSCGGLAARVPFDPPLRIPLEL